MTHPQKPIEAEVKEVITERHLGESSIQIARRHNISSAHVRDIYSGKIWKSLDDFRSKIKAKNNPDFKLIGEKHPLSKLTKDQAKEIILACHRNESGAVVGKRYGLAATYARSIYLGTCWKSLDGFRAQLKAEAYRASKIGK